MIKITPTKRMTILLLLFAALMAACGSSEPAEQNAIDTDSDEQAIEAPEPTVDNSGPAAPTEIAFEAAYQIETDPAVAGEARDRDWVKGASEPVVTVVEYGDFQ